jgi:hypothetical protein
LFLIDTLPSRCNGGKFALGGHTYDFRMKPASRRSSRLSSERAKKFFARALAEIA